MKSRNKILISFILAFVMLCLETPFAAFSAASNNHTHSYENSICTTCGIKASQYLQQLPKDIIGCTNLYEILTPIKGYYTATKYDTNNGDVLSIVIPVEAGDRISANSFGNISENMGSLNGIRVTYLSGDKIAKSLSPNEVYSEYRSNGYITVPDSVTAVCVPWWKPSKANWLTLSQISKNFAIHSSQYISEQAPTCTKNGYTAGAICEICNTTLSGRDEISQLDHSYSDDVCVFCGAVNLNEFLYGKYVSILGDSISTFNGYSNDASINTTIGKNGHRYDVGTADTKPGSYCLLESVNDTWWARFANQNRMKLLVNNSWAGSQVFGGKTGDGRTIPAAYIDRCVNLHDNTTENNANYAPIYPDVIFVYLGINDYNFNRNNVGYGAVDYANLINDDGTYITPSTFGEAYGIMLHKMKEFYPDAQIFAMTLLPENLYSVDKSAWEQHNFYIREAAEYYDIPVVDLAKNCRITWENYSGYMMDKIHPTTEGMKLIADCIESELQIFYKQALPHSHTYENGVCTGCGEEHPNLENYEGKVISVLGDSISTFKGYIPTADGFNEEHPSTYPARDVRSWDKTWWGLVIDRLDAKLGINDSWSGSRVQNTYTAENPGGNVGTKVCMSSLTRITNLGTNGTPDVILVYGGTNDGKFSKFGGFDPTKDYSQVDLDAVTWSTFEEAYVAMIMRLQYFYPNAKIVVVLPTNVSSWYTDEKLEIMNDSITQICEYFDIEYVNTPECGITLADLPDGLHPNAKGMEYIANAVLEILLNTNEITAGENVVHSIEHRLDGAVASCGHYKGISNNNSFTERLSGNFECVYITMNGADITEDCYKDGIIRIENVIGDVVITAKQHSYTSVVTPPTCAEQGYTTYTCDCGDSYEGDYTDATGEHIYESGFCVGCGKDDPAPTITKQPASAMKNLGDCFTFTVEAEGEGLSYQWYYRDASMSEFRKSSVQEATYSFEMLEFRVGREYYCVIIDQNGLSVKTNVVKSTTPLTIIEQPKDVSLNIGEQVDISVKAVGEGLSYQWYYKDHGDTEFKKSAFSGEKYSRSMEEFCHGRQVYCVISDAYGNSAETAIAEMTLPPKELTIIAEPKDVQAEIGQQFEVSVEAEGDDLTYQWYYKDAYMKDFEISSNQTSSYSYTMEEYRHNRQLYCIITDKYGDTVKTQIVTITRK